MNKIVTKYKGYIKENKKYTKQEQHPQRADFYQANISHKDWFHQTLRLTFILTLLHLHQMHCLS